MDGALDALRASSDEAVWYCARHRKETTRVRCGRCYNTDPPTSGPHYTAPVPPGVYTAGFAPGFLVHSLEHSNIVIYIDRRFLTQAEIDALTRWPACTRTHSRELS